VEKQKLRGQINHHIDRLLADVIMKYRGFPDTPDYDMHGFTQGYLEGDPHATMGVNPNDSRPHFTDYWKRPEHPTFSAESQYARGIPDAPSWEGGALPNGGESWALRRPNGDLVASEAPWNVGGIRHTEARLLRGE